MKKTKVIALVLVAAVMLMGAGYAYWSQDLNINTTVDTGDLKLEFKELLLSNLIGDHGGYDNSTKKDYIDVDIDVDPYNIAFDVHNIYPGAGGYLNFRIANTGTVPARLTGLEYDLKTGTTLDELNQFQYKIHNLRLYTPKQGVRIVGIDWSNWKFITENFTYIDLDLEGAPIVATSFENFVDQLQDRLDNYTLEPFSFLEINGEGTGYDIIMPSTVTDNTLQGQDDMGFDLTMTFTQGE